jgi:tellurite methyltransferase
MKTVLVCLTLLTSVSWSKPHETDFNQDVKQAWNFRYSLKGFFYGTQPIPFIVDSLPYLPKNGKVLDLAMGEGRNGVFLAKLGYDVLGVDISDVGLKKAEELARKNKTQIKTQVADLSNFPLEENSYDVIIMSYYMGRELFPKIKRALKKDGVAIIENNTEEHLKYNPTMKPEWMLKKNELFEHFSDLKVLRFQNIDDGKNAYSSLLVKKI